MEAVLVRASPRGPAEALAMVETVAVRGAEGAWLLLEAGWPWEARSIGVLSPPPAGPFIRRATGGPVFPSGRDTAYVALVGPRGGGRPPSLESVYRTLRGVLEGCRVLGPLERECWGARVAVSAGKLAQRPLLELAGPRGAVDRIVRGAFEIVDETLLPREMILRESLSRLASPEWNWTVPPGATHRAEIVTGEGFTLGAVARLEPPLVAWLRLYGDILVYPPAQALLLVDQLQGAPPSPPAVLELLNAWAVLVETVGATLEELGSVLYALVEDMARDAGL